MLLTVNVGNSNIAYGIFDGMVLMRHGRVDAEDYLLLPERIGPERFAKIAIGSVAPKKMKKLIPILASRYPVPVLVAGEDLPFNVEIQCDQPGKVGPDRILNALAACARTRGASIIADVGTATTVDYVSAQGTFCGGVIAPGPGTMLRALHAHAELLPEVSFERPASILGRDTVGAIRSGVYFSTVGLIETLIKRITAQQGGSPAILITGGYGEFVAAELNAQFVPTLTLEGLSIVAAQAE